MGSLDADSQRNFGESKDLNKFPDFQGSAWLLDSGFSCPFVTIQDRLLKTPHNYLLFKIIANYILVTSANCTALTVNR